jgi:hypothetical protein
MTPFDPSTFGRVVSEFSAAAHQKFHALLPAREHIAELRRKGASYATIARFCHEELGEKPRTRRRVMARRPSQLGSSGDAVVAQSSSTIASLPAPVVAPSGRAEGSQLKLSELLPPLPPPGSPGAPSRRSRGPRIAHIPLADTPDP